MQESLSRFPKAQGAVVTLTRFQFEAQTWSAYDHKTKKNDQSSQKKLQQGNFDISQDKII